MSTKQIQQIYPRGKNRIYWMRFRYNGERIHESTGTVIVAEALTRLEEKKRKLDAKHKGNNSKLEMPLSTLSFGQITIADSCSVKGGKEGSPSTRAIYLRGRKYWMRFRYKGQRIHQSTGTSDKQTAIFLLLNKKYELLVSRIRAERFSDVRFEDAALLAFNHHFRQQRSALANAYKILVLCDLIGNRSVTRFNQATFNAIEIALESRGCTANTINRYFSAINTVLEIARSKFNAPCSPIPKVHLATKRKVVRCISSGEEEQILAYLSHEQRSLKSQADWSADDLIEIYQVGVLTGMRRGELFSFRVEQVAGQTIRLTPEQHKTGDTQGEKTIILPRSATAIIEARIQRLDLKSDERVFSYSKNAFTRLWTRMKMEIGLENDRLFTPHCMRHTFASRMAKRGLPIYHLSKMLGHTTVKTTEMYAHLYNDDLVDAMNSFLP